MDFISWYKNFYSLGDNINKKRCYYCTGIYRKECSICRLKLCLFCAIKYVKTTDEKDTNEINTNNNCFKIDPLNKQKFYETWHCKDNLNCQPVISKNKVYVNCYQYLKINENFIKKLQIKFKKRYYIMKISKTYNLDYDVSSVIYSYLKK
jgi:hypothetical protein